MSDPFVKRIHREATGAGFLSGTRLAVKDMFELAGEVCGFGSPDWLRTHEPAEADCPVVTRLLGQGATLVGKTHMEELAFSLTGENAHYGTPSNPAAPERIPGGSSSGSAVAVAAGLVDFSLGTDTGGSIRVPASHCGVLGIRTTHGAIGMEGILPLAPSFDAVGWFARDVELLDAVARVLLPESRCVARTLLIADDAFELCSCETVAWSRGTETIASAFDLVKHVRISEDLAPWAEAFRVLQGAEAWAAHGAWIESARPQLGPSIRRRFEYARSVSQEQLPAARVARTQARARVLELLENDAVLCVPSAPGPAPFRGESGDETESFRERTMRLTCIAGLSGTPQLSIPAGTKDGAPIGLSLIGRHGADLCLIELAGSVLGAGRKEGSTRRNAGR